MPSLHNVNDALSILRSSSQQAPAGSTRADPCERSLTPEAGRERSLQRMGSQNRGRVRPSREHSRQSRRRGRFARPREGRCAFKIPAGPSRLGPSSTHRNRSPSPLGADGPAPPKMYSLPPAALGTAAKPIPSRLGGGLPDRRVLGPSHERSLSQVAHPAQPGSYGWRSYGRRETGHCRTCTRRMAWHCLSRMERDMPCVLRAARKQYSCAADGNSRRFLFILEGYDIRPLQLSYDMRISLNHFKTRI